MAAKPLPDADLLRQLLRYEPDTGKLFWRERPLEMFKSGGSGQEFYWRIWNDRYAEQEVSPMDRPKGSRGYRIVGIFKSKYLFHRIAWKIVTGEDPDEIDHINGDTADNRWCNLRNVTTAENKRNLAKSTRNRSGCTGVFWNSQFNRWQSFITVGLKTKHLGLHKTKESAIRARKSAEREMGFHPNHGRKKANERK